MPQKIKVMVEGVEQEQEVYSGDELKAQAEARAKEIADAEIAAAKEAMDADKEAALLEKDEEFKKDKDELEKLRKKDFNFRELEKKGQLTDEQKKEAEKAAEALKKANERIDAIEKQPLESARESFIASNFSEEEKDQKEVFEVILKKLSIGVKDLKGMNEAMVMAFNATTGGARQPSRTGQMIHTSVNENYSGDQSGRESEVSQGFGAALGVTAEDKKKYAGAVVSSRVHLFSQNPPKAKE